MNLYLYSDNQTSSPPDARADQLDADVPRASSPQSIIIKIWLERYTDSDKPAVWRGRMTHVESGKQIYVQDVWHVQAVLLQYLISMNARLPFIWRLIAYITRLLHRKPDEVHETP